jgi:hypothetical protein
LDDRGSTSSEYVKSDFVPRHRTIAHREVVDGDDQEPRSSEVLSEAVARMARYREVPVTLVVRATR